MPNFRHNLPSILPKTLLLACLIALLFIISVILVAQPLSHADSPPPPSEAVIFLRLSPSELKQVMADRPQLEPLVQVDYGSFHWLGLPASQAISLQRAGLSLRPQTDPFRLMLGGQNFDPLTESASLRWPAGWQDESLLGAAEADLHLVQLIGPPKSEWLSQLQTAGLTPVQYIHPYSYVVWGSGASRQRASNQLDFVRWVGHFAPAYRVQSSARQLGEGPQDALLLAYRQVSLKTLTAELSLLGGEGLSISQNSDPQFHLLRLRLPGSAFAAAASLPGVYSLSLVPQDGGIRGEMANQVNVGQVLTTNLAYPGYQLWLTDLGLSGAGIVMANVDEGVDETHPDLRGRFLPCTGVTCGGPSSTHGTHTAGLMAGDGSSGVRDEFGFLRGQGMAPAAKLIEQTFSPTYLEPGGMRLLMQDSVKNGVIVSSNSWGPSSAAQGYDAYTRLVDLGIRDADPDRPGEQSLSYILSIMNGYGGVSSQGSPDEAKNTLTVGSSKLQSINGNQLTAINSLSSNSGHGPALDGRLIPHLVAPGCQVDSTQPNQSYSLKCGTSMAGPLVSGAVGLFMEQYQRAYLETPSPALVKAAFLPVAHSLAGFTDADGGLLGQPFDAKQGWGRLNVTAVLAPETEVLYVDAPALLTDTGQVWQKTFLIDKSDQPVRLMLAWTDAPGHGLGGTTPAWNNDLDLEVLLGDSLYRANYFEPDEGWSLPDGPSDYANNTEAVFLPPTDATSITVRVRASNLNSDGVPDNAWQIDQDFALVCYNCHPDPTFTLRLTPNTQALCLPDSAEFRLQVASLGDYNGTVRFSAGAVPPNADFSFSPASLTPPGESYLTFVAANNTPPGRYALPLHASDFELTRTITLNLTLRDSPPPTLSPIFPQPGQSDLSRQPSLKWYSDSLASTYQFELASDPSFSSESVLTSLNLSDTRFTVTDSLRYDSTYYWRIGAENICGAGPVSPVFSFTTRSAPPVLLVDDDDNTPDVRGFYTAALQALGRDFDVWDTDNGDTHEPPAEELTQYAHVIWFSGDAFGLSPGLGAEAGPGSAGEAALRVYLAEDGCLFLSAQEYFYDKGLTDFMRHSLGVAEVEGEGWQIEGDLAVEGRHQFAGYGPYPLDFPGRNFSDVISPSETAQIAWQSAPLDVNGSGDGSTPTVGISQAETGRSLFLSFPWEAITPDSARQASLGRFLQWCQGETSPEPHRAVSLSQPPPQQGYPGETLSYVFSVTNTGQISDVYDIGLQSAWPSAIGTPNSNNPAWLLLGPNEVRYFTISLTIPPTAFLGRQQQITVSLTSRATPPIRIKQSVSTTVIPNPAALNLALGLSVTPAPGPCTEPLSGSGQLLPAPAPDRPQVLVACHHLSNRSPYTLSRHHLTEQPPDDSGALAWSKTLTYALPPGETWVYSRSLTLTQPSRYTVTWLAWLGEGTLYQPLTATASLSVTWPSFEGRVYLPLVVRE